LAFATARTESAVRRYFIRTTVKPATRVLQRVF
jgi:hypothetical protein